MRITCFLSLPIEALNVRGIAKAKYGEKEKTTMATRTTEVKSGLFKMGRRIDVLDGEPKTGERSDLPKSKAVGIRSRFGEEADATLNCAAFLVKALVKKELHLAIAPDDSLIYGEFDHTDKRDGSVRSWQFACALTPAPMIGYREDAMEEESPYDILPYVAAKTFFCGDEELIGALADAYTAILEGSPDATDRVFIFCDSFYYHVKDMFMETSYEVCDHAFAETTMMEARRMGHLLDLGVDAEAEFMTKQCRQLLANKVELPVCTLLAGITPDVPKKEKKEKKSGRETKSSWKSMLRDIKAGKYLIPYEWSDEQLAHIPPLSYLDTFIPSEEYFEILRKIEYRIGDHMVSAVELGATEPDDIKNDIVNILLYGDPGSGKTALAHGIAATTRMPLYSIKFNEDSEDDTFEGKNKIVDGKISFVGTEFLKGYENGGILLLEEINLGRANMLTSVMNQAMEYPFYIEKNGYEQIHRHPLVVTFATMNLDTDGTMSLNSAMAQRFNNKYMIGEPSAKAFKERLTANGFPEDRVNHVYGIYSKIRDYLKENSQRQKYLKELSIRQCIAALQDMEEGTSFAGAIQSTMYGAICIKNRKLADQIKDAILDTYPDYVGE